MARISHARVRGGPERRAPSAERPAGAAWAAVGDEERANRAAGAARPHAIRKPAPITRGQNPELALRGGDDAL